METRPYLLHSLSPLHLGVGHSVDIVDLPITRMQSTGNPTVPGSSVEGVLRDVRGETGAGVTADQIRAVFGPDTANASANAGAPSVGDARLLALPVRSFKGTFAWVTSPVLLGLATRDLAGVQGLPPQIPQPTLGAALVGPSNRAKWFTALEASQGSFSWTWMSRCLRMGPSPDGPVSCLDCCSRRGRHPCWNLGLPW